MDFRGESIGKVDVYNDHMKLWICDSDPLWKFIFSLKNCKNFKSVLP